MTAPEDNAGRLPPALSFGTAPDAYERGRPSYPPEAVDWLLRGAGPRLLDLGAGTGKLTRLLLNRAAQVTAVEPSAGMRARLRATTPGADVREGTAEAIPLPTGTVDAVLVGQAWHWVDTDLALPEVARVLTPGGVLALCGTRRTTMTPGPPRPSA